MSSTTHCHLRQWWSTTAHGSNLHLTVVVGVFLEFSPAKTPNQHLNIEETHSHTPNDTHTTTYVMAGNSK